VTPKLDILVCSGCGAPVALADVATVTCTSCGAATAVPVSHRAAFAAMRREVEGNAEARALYAKLGEPPRALRAIGIVFDPSELMRPARKSRVWLVRLLGWYYRWALLVIAPLVILGIAIVAEFLVVRAIGAHYHVELETLATATRDWYEMPLPVIAVIGGVVAGVYGRRKAVDRSRLQAALAAGRPAHAGGPSTCRRCGGPLSVDGDALGVRCVYCGADNLVALPVAWVDHIKEHAAQIDAEITHANAELVARQKRLRRSLLLRVTPVLLFVGTMLIVTVASGGEDERLDKELPSWTVLAKNPRGLGLRDEVSDPSRHDRRVPRTGVVPIAFDHGCPVQLAPASAVCTGQTCTLHLYAALRHGESATLTLTGAPAGTHVRIERHHGFPWPKSFDADFGALEADVPVGDDGVTHFAATWSAWHELAVVMPGATAKPIGVCFSVP
jgi:hypothetical protein